MKGITAGQYIIAEPSGQQWHFFYQPGSGICFKKKAETKWNNYEILLKDGQSDFDVMIDSRGNIHLACQDQVGSIIYLMYNGTQWHKYTILQSKANRTYPKHFKMLSINGWINLFYIIEYKGKNLLIHQILDNNNVSPNVIDYISKTERPFCVQADSSNNIHIYYQSESDSGRLGYKTYIWSKKQWSDFISIGLDSNVLFPYFILDKEDHFHLVFLRKAHKGYSIIYKRKPSSSYNQSLWDKETMIYNRCDTQVIPIIIKEDKRLWILWQMDIKVFSCYSDNDGIEWNKPAQFSAGRYGNIGLFGCRTADLLLKQNIICDMCYGYSGNDDINLYIVSDYLDKIPDSAHVKPEYMIPGSEVEEFARQNMKSFAAAADSEASPAPYMEKTDAANANIELTKLKIMFNMLQEEIAQIKKYIPIETSKQHTLEKYDTEISNIKKQLEDLAEKTNHTLKNLKDELIQLKRTNHRISFNDLMEKQNKS